MASLGDAVQFHSVVESEMVVVRLLCCRTTFLFRFPPAARRRIWTQSTMGEQGEKRALVRRRMEETHTSDSATVPAAIVQRETARAEAGDVPRMNAKGWSD